MLNRGLLPSHYASAHWRKSLDGYVVDYLKEEVFDEGLTRNVPAFSRFFEGMGWSHGELTNFAKIARESGVDSKTVKEYYQILCDTLLGRFVPPYKKRQDRQLITKAAKFYLFDVGVARALTRRRIEEPRGEQFGRALDEELGTSRSCPGDPSSRRSGPVRSSASPRRRRCVTILACPSPPHPVASPQTTVHAPSRVWRLGPGSAGVPSPAPAHPGAPDRPAGAPPGPHAAWERRLPQQPTWEWTFRHQLRTLTSCPAAAARPREDSPLSSTSWCSRFHSFIRSAHLGGAAMSKFQPPVRLQSEVQGNEQVVCSRVRAPACRAIPGRRRRRHEHSEEIGDDNHRAGDTDP